MPAYVRAAFGDDAEDAVAELIADGILEAEVDGSWLSGPAAFRPRLPPDEIAVAGTSGKSQRALRAAAALSADEDDVATFLYRYGSTPIAPDRARRWADAETIHRDLRLDRVGPDAVLSTDRAWWVFPGEEGPPDRVGHKLYVGVGVPAVAEAIERIGRLRYHDIASAPSFKVGASPQGLHRPDRLVLYPSSASASADWGERLADVLADLPVDPVAFTAAVDRDGRVSRGVDAPRFGRTWWRDDSSWRAFVTLTLAAALVEARRQGTIEPWRYAFDRIRLAGIDPDTWSRLAEPVP